MKKIFTPMFGSRGGDGKVKANDLDDVWKIISSTLNDFDCPVGLVEAIDGYSNYHFFFQPKKPTRMKSFPGYLDDLKYALGNNDVEIEAPIPDKKLVGITVSKKQFLPSLPFGEALKWEELTSGTLRVPLGIDEFGGRHLANLARMPHLLIGGATGSGKSVLLHTMINALVAKNDPDFVRFILMDPRRTDLTLYAGLPHLLTPPITEAKKALRALTWAVKEMARRYDILQAEGVRGIDVYYKNIYQPARSKWEKAGSDYLKINELPEPLPFIIIIIDEMNDFMQAYPKELEALIVRLAQMSRAVGIHLILATQRPSVSVVTGTIKANIPARIALSVASQVDSRTIIDRAGAEKLRGNGDMLFLMGDSLHPLRIQGLSITEEEIKKRVKELSVGPSLKGTNDLDLSDGSSQSFMSSLSEDAEGEDELFDDAKQAVMEAGKASTSYLQRKLRIGYARAARLIDLLEETGVIGSADGAAPRKVKDNDK